MKKSTLLLILTALGITACASQPTPQNIPPTEKPASYPAPIETNLQPVQVDPAYPAPTESNLPPPPYPMPTQVIIIKTSSVKDIVPFRINKPVKPGANEVSGSGPANVPVILVSITVNGDLLGEGTIDANGTYTIKTIRPILEGERIGVTIGNLSGSPYTDTDFDDNRFNAEEAMFIPQIGYFFDTTFISGD